MFSGKNMKLAVFLVGPSGSGKTTFIKFLKDFFGTCQAGFNAKNLDGLEGNSLNPALASIVDATYAFAEEGISKINPETFKVMAGGDSEVYVRKCRENGKSQAPKCTMWFASNSKPGFSSFPDDATIRRICMFNLVHRFDDSKEFTFNTPDYYNAFFQILMNIDPINLHSNLPQEVIANRKSFSMTSSAELSNIWKRISRVSGGVLRLVDFGNVEIAPAYLKAAISNHYGETYIEALGGWNNLSLGESVEEPFESWDVPALIFPKRLP
jgi:GTPase SAR1 family protein